jgi:hypothetical protein
VESGGSVENDGSYWSAVIVAQLGHTMQSAEFLHRTRSPVVTGTPVRKVGLLENLENRDTGLASLESGVCQHRRKLAQGCRS